MTVLDLFLVLLMLGPLLSERFFAGRTLEYPPAFFDQGGSHGFEENAVLGCLNDRFGAFLDAELLAQPVGDHDLSLRCEFDGICFTGHTLCKKSYLSYKVSQYLNTGKSLANTAGTG